VANRAVVTDFASSMQPQERDRHFYSAMKKADYYRTRAWELRRDAARSRDAKVKQSKLETAAAFERLGALTKERRPRNASRRRNASGVQAEAAGAIRAR
jgi:hypothetical protein